MTSGNSASASSDGPIIATEGLGRDFRVRGKGLRTTTTTAVDELSVRIDPGSAVGYIGANGAGKSTTIKMLVGILVPTRGTVRTCGLDPQRQRREVARHVGVVFGQRSQLWWDLPVHESFRVLAAVHGLSPGAERGRTDELVEHLELGPFLTTPVRQLSLGQRMRAEVAAALLHSPRLVILDEPTIGLDVVSKQRLRDFLIAERTAHGTTLLLTTHDTGDIERLCDRILVVDRGRQIFDGTLGQLSQSVGTDRVLTVDLVRPLPPVGTVTGAISLDGAAPAARHRYRIEGDAIGGVLTALGSEVRDLTVAEADIEDVVRRLYLAQRPRPPHPEPGGE